MNGAHDSTLNREPQKLYSNLLLIKIMNGLYIAINQIGRFYFIIIIIIIVISIICG